MTDISRLQSQLLTSGLQQKDFPLFQVISQLIKELASLSASVSGGSNTNTVNNITNQNNLIAPSGDNSEIIDNYYLQNTINNILNLISLLFASSDNSELIDNYYVINQGSSGSSIDTYAAPLTNGDALLPELVFDSFGDVVMVTGLV